MSVPHRTTLSGPYHTTMSGPYQRGRNSPPPSHYYPTTTMSGPYYRGPTFSPPLTPSECGGRYPSNTNYYRSRALSPPMAPSGDYDRSPALSPPMAPCVNNDSQKQNQRKHHLFKEKIQEEEKQVSKMLQGSLYVPSDAQVQIRGMQIRNIGGFRMRFGGLSIEKWEDKVGTKMEKYDYDQYKIQLKKIPPDVSRITYLIRYLCESEEECYHNLEVTYNIWDGIKQYTPAERPRNSIIPVRPKKRPSDYVTARIYVKTWVGHAIQIATAATLDNADITAASRHWWDKHLPQHESLIRQPFKDDPRVNPFAKRAPIKPAFKTAELDIDTSIIKELTLNEWQVKQIASNKIIDIYFCSEYVQFIMKFPMYNLDFQEMKTPSDSKCENVKNKTLGTNALDTPEELYSPAEAQRYQNICETILTKYEESHVKLVE